MMGRLRLLCLCSLVVVVLSMACAPEPAATEPVARGRQIYREMGCASCHDGSLFNLFRAVGPPLNEIGLVGPKRIPGMSAEDYLRQSMTDPGAYVAPGYPDSMPRGLARDLSPEELAALVAYLASLR